MTREQAERELARYTCILWRGETVFRSSRRGVTPLMTLLKGDVQGFWAADRVVGRASAMLYCLLKVRALYARVITRAAAELLQAHGITAEWGTMTDCIRNRAGDGPCPMELATRELTEPEQAPDAIRRALAALDRDRK